MSNVTLTFVIERQKIERGTERVRGVGQIREDHLSFCSLMTSSNGGGMPFTVRRGVNFDLMTTEDAFTRKSFRSL